MTTPDLRTAFLAVTEADGPPTDAARRELLHALHAMVDARRAAGHPIEEVITEVKPLAQAAGLPAVGFGPWSARRVAVSDIVRLCIDRYFQASSSGVS